MLTYKDSGVDIKKGDSFKRQIASLVRSSATPHVLNDIGGFGGFFEFCKNKFKNPVLVSSCDGVGTKLKIATMVSQHNTVGIDVVAMNVNDILCSGARPLFFLDYIAYSKVDSDVLFSIIKGLNRGCLQAGCSLIGGETAQMPGMYNEDEYDLAGFCVGVVERDRIIDGSGIESGDVLVGLPSSGLHSNGFSLVRKVFSKVELKRYAKELLRPTRIYTQPILSLLRKDKIARRQKDTVRGIAHITGGAFYSKISRILPDSLNAYVDKNSWRVPKIFRLIQNKGEVTDQEMYRTFNMGIGMVLIVSKKGISIIMAELVRSNLEPLIIGEITKGDGEVVIGF